MTKRLLFFYDTQDKQAVVEFNGTKYTYVYNLQGDVVGIIDSTGNVVVEYSYDAWGKTIATTANSTLTTQLAELNPFRYRGYVWYGETNLYYLRSRYFNPILFKFISADALLDSNIFCYCKNSPVFRVDEKGYFESKPHVKQYEPSGGAGSAAGIGGIAIAYELYNLFEIVVGWFTSDNSNTNTNSNTRNNDSVAVNSIDYNSIAASFDLLQCEQCAVTMKEANGEHGRIIKVFFPDAHRGFVVSDRYENAISNNGTHYGYEYNEIVHCLIYPEGLPKEDWINSFHDSSGNRPIVTYP